jgi:hypothetical protein
MEYRHPPLYYWRYSALAFRSKIEQSRELVKKSPCIEIELIGKL